MSGGGSPEVAVTKVVSVTVISVVETVAARNTSGVASSESQSGHVVVVIGNIVDTGMQNHTLGQ